MTKPFELFVDEKFLERGLHPEARALEEADCLSLKETGPCGISVAPMSADGSGYCYPHNRLKQDDTGTVPHYNSTPHLRIHCLPAPRLLALECPNDTLPISAAGR